MNNFYTYELCSSETPSLPFYIGKGKGYRMYHHEWEAKHINHSDSFKNRKILKILKDGYHIVYRKIAENVSEQDAFTIEKDMIAFNRSLEFKLCNHTNGGDGSVPDEETRKKLSIAQTGKISPFKNRHHTDEARRKNSESHKGIPKGPLSEKTKEKIGISLKGKIPWNKGLKNCFSEEVRKKMSEAAKRRCARQKEEKLKNEKK